MTLFLTADNGNGVAFNRRRQSRDSVLISDILSSAKGIIKTTEYSAKLFADAQNIFVCDNIFASADGNVFCECVDASPYYKLFETIIVYKWNRDYPHDITLSKTPAECGFVLCDTYDFVGSSHDNITKEVWHKHI